LQRLNEFFYLEDRMKRKNTGVLGVVLLLLIGAYLPAAGQKAQDTGGVTAQRVKLRAAYHPGMASAAVPAINEVVNNYFAEEGLDVEWLRFTAAPPEVAAIVSGDLQFGYIGHGGHTLAIDGKVDVIAFTHEGNSEAILTRASSGIKTIQDLKGKTVATQFGTSGEVILNLAFNKYGLSRNDVNVINMDISGAVSAFIAGQVDVISAWSNHRYNILNNVTDPLVTLATTADFKDIISFPASWVASPEFIEKNPDVALRIVRALFKCYDYRTANMDGTINAMIKFVDITKEAAEFERDMNTYYSSKDISTMINNGELLGIYKKHYQYFVDSGVISAGKGRSPEQYVRFDLMKKALE
jgi:NitT/TauT family transport system substrate-binding protein